MTDEPRIPSHLLRALCESIIENLGQRSLRLLFARAGIEGRYKGDDLPPNDDTPSITPTQFGNVFTNAFEIFGDKGIKPILMRAGREGIHHLREHNKTLDVLAGAAFKILPHEAKVKLLLSRVARVGQEQLHVPHHFSDTPEGYFMEIRNSPFCAGLSGYDHGVCYVPQAVYAEGMRWATGKSYAVDELECGAMGHDRCLFRISKEPVSEEGNRR
jgi:predicted hydrocarbon binding protein